MRHSIKTAVIGLLLLGSMAANAGPISWAFSYTGTGVSASGVLSTNDLSGGTYLINGISGQRNGEAILGLVPAGTIFTPGGSLFSDNLLYPVSPFLTTWASPIRHPAALTMSARPVPVARALATGTSTATTLRSRRSSSRSQGFPNLERWS